MTTRTYNASLGRYAAPVVKRGVRELDFTSIRTSADEFSGKVINSLNSIPEVKSFRNGNSKGMCAMQTSYKDKVLSLAGLGAFLVSSMISMMIFL